MSEPTLQAQIDAATAYESLFVPALFEQWAPRVADAARVATGLRVLDVACGTGVVAREALTRVGGGGHVVGIDPNAGMLAVALDRAPEIDWKKGVAEELPFPDSSFDAVVSQFGLMFFADRVKGLREMLRVLRPGGHLAVAVWDALEANPAFAAEDALLAREAGDEAAEALRAPFALGDPDRLAALLAQAGISSPEIATHAGTARFPSIRTMVEADLRGWLPLVGVHLADEKITRILESAERDLAAFTDASGHARFTVSAHIASAVRG